MNKIETATEIVKNGIDARTSSQQLKLAIQIALEVSKPNANVYWHKACKRLGVRITNGE